MSLLMDALRKAEQAKRQAQATTESTASPPTDPASSADGGASGLSLEPISSDAALPSLDNAVVTPPETVNAPQPGAAPELALTPQTAADDPRSRLPDLSPSMVVRDEDFQDVMPVTSKRAMARPTTGTSTPAQSREVPSRSTVERTAASPASGSDNATTAKAERDAVNNVFAAKTPAPRDGNNKTFAITVGVFSLAAALGIGGYFWWQLQPRNGASFLDTLMAGAKAPTLPTIPRPAAPVPTPPAQIASAPATAAAPATQAAPPIATEVVPATTAATTAAPTPAATDAATARPQPGKQRGAQRSTARPPVEEAPPDDGPVHLTRSPLTIHPLLNAAYDAVSRGDLPAARDYYGKVLASDPNDAMALHGLATIALREGRAEQADHWYRQALLANPRDARALSGLAEVYARANPDIAESKLRGIAAAFPDAPGPQVALGNLYSRLGRWPEAQQAFFAAYAHQPENPDILFNLAVCLEHMAKPALAKGYYADALKAARNQPAQFDTSLAADRLRALSQ